MTKKARARMDRFLIVGVAGFVARRHLEAAKSVGGQVVAGVDPNDSVGIMDTFAPGARFFRSLEEAIDAVGHGDGPGRNFVCVCSPSNLHFQHVVTALNAGWEVICEKPLVTSVGQLDALLGRPDAGLIWPVLQLREHQNLGQLKERIAASPIRVPVELTYTTPRSEWYHKSWKGNVAFSGGLLLNIGIHLFDMLCWIFGRPSDLTVSSESHDRSSGTLTLERACVKWSLSVASEDHPDYAPGRPLQAFRRLVVGDEVVDFSDVRGLHQDVYRRIVTRDSTTLRDAETALRLLLSEPRVAGSP